MHMTENLNFSYQAADAHGRRVDGELMAASETAALEALASQGLRVFRIQAAAGAPITDRRARSVNGFYVRRISNLQRVWLFDELATLLESGVVLVEAIDNLRAPAPESALGVGLSLVNSKLRGGATLSTALSECGLALPRYVTELIRAGESTGRLAGAARAAAQQQLAEYEFGREVRNALIYPAVLVGSGVLAMLVVFVFVVPKFSSILDNPKAELPLISVWVLRSGVWLAANGVLVAGTLAIVMLALLWAMRQPNVRRAGWEAASRLPLARAWVRDTEAYRWSSMLGLLMQNRVSLLEALSQANATLRGRDMAARGKRVVDAVRQGKSLAAALTEQAMVDRSALSLVRVGEQSGSLDKSLITLASRYRSAGQQRVKRFLVLLEPVTILLISLFLGGVMISVILAVTSLTNII